MIPQPVLDDEEAKLLAQLRETIKLRFRAEEEDTVHSLKSDRDLVRFLRARKGNVEEAAALWDETMQWRSEHAVSRWRSCAPGPKHSKAAIDAYEQFGFESLNNIEKHPYVRLVAPLPREREISYHRWVVNGHFGHDKEGHPLYWERTGIGAQLFPNLVKELTHDEIVFDHIRQQELALAKCEEASIKYNKYVGKQTVIMDMDGMSYWPRAGGFSVFKRILVIDSKYYPETLARHYIINAPWVFTKIWALIKPMLDPVTANKVHIMGKDYLPTLLEAIDAHQIPREFGGTSEMELGHANAAEGVAEAFVDALYAHTVTQAGGVPEKDKGLM
eukprot:TRINITY_DN77808_c0_g1_i1.p1 TRINITY_DN77808_c0_g1~~TRINITY_DN77808_c0_g1_i1.p1  ORF type:complete len:331 (+),score=40.96 TRINITY_DN77808_c0_g1_i1:62-1054(+)